MPGAPSGNGRTYGEIRLENGRWHLTGRPHLVTRVKRVFARIPTGAHGTLIWKNTAEVCRDLEWFMERYPIEISASDRAALEAGARHHKETILRLDQLIDKKYKGKEFELAIPARDYQKLAAELFLEREFLLLADDVGSGKTVSALCALTRRDTLPAIVVTLSGTMPRQWQDMTKAFLPGMTTHVVEKGSPYPLPKFGRRGPDMVILNYHKLHGWADTLAEYANSVIFDECQELRRQGSYKYEAAEHLARGVRWKIGLSVGADSMILVDDGFLVRHTRIEDFAESVGAMEDIFVPVEGIKVRAFDGKSFCWKPVKAVLKHKTAGKKTFRIRTEKGRSLLLTEDHSIYRAVPDGFLTHRGNRIPEKRGNSKAKPFLSLELVKGADLREGDHVLMEDSLATDRTIDHLDISDYITASQWYVTGDFADWINTNVTVGKGVEQAWLVRHRQKAVGLRGTYVTADQFMSDPDLRKRGGKIHTRGKGGIWTESRIPVEDFAYVLGFYVGDGWLSDSRVCFAVEKPRLRSFLKKLCPLLRWTKVNVSVREMPGASVEVRFSNAVLASFLRGFFRNARAWEKQIPDEAFAFATGCVRKFIQGMLDSDGSFAVRPRGRKAWYYTTTSRELAYGLAELLKRVGVVAGISKSEGARGGLVAGRRIRGRRPKYQVYFSHYEWMGDNTGWHGRRSRFESNGIGGFPVRIKQIEEEPSEYVYDLSVEGNQWQTFVASGVLVHNSATPIFNLGGEIWSIVNVLCEDALGTYEEFCREWCTRFVNARNAPAVADPKALGSYLRAEHIMLRRTRKELGRELPPLTKIPQFIESDEYALKSVEGSAAELAKVILSQEEVAGWDRLRATEEFDQILRQATGVAKAPYAADFIRLLAENDEPVLVFCWHRAVYEILLQKLKDLGPVMYTGSETASEKQKAKDAFVAGETKIMLMSLRAGQGIDGLQKACNTVVVVELDWSPGIIEQDIGRILRDGQENPVTAYILVSERGSDPVVAEKLGLKTAQIAGLRDPDYDLVEELQVDKDRVKELARRYLDKIGKAAAAK